MIWMLCLRWAKYWHGYVVQKQGYSHVGFVLSWDFIGVFNHL